MSQYPQPTRADHDQFCRIEGWRRVRNAKGKKGSHHITYELDLPDGRVLRTRVSHPPDRTDYGAKLWVHILRDQLEISEAGFWACVHNGARPDRGGLQVPHEGLPVDLAYLLVHRVGLSDQEVAHLTRGEAIERLNRFWQSGS